jgi:hypothetical protein
VVNQDFHGEEFNPLRPRAFGGKGAEGMKKEITLTIHVKKSPQGEKNDFCYDNYNFE